MSTLADWSNRAASREDGAGCSADPAAARSSTRDQSKAVSPPAHKSGKESSLYKAIAELAGAVSDEHRADPDAVLAGFTALAVVHLRSVHHCGVMSTDDKGRLCSVTGTDDYACVIQQIQQQSRCGPCLQAAS